MRAALASALASGHGVLAAGGSAVDAVVAAVCVLEDCEWLNAGRGSVLDATGRVSDSALIGAGSFADDATCALSATGTGDAFIRAGFAHAVDALLRHTGQGLEAACQRALASVRALGGSGGCIALDAAGRVALPFDTEWMARGLIGPDGRPRVALRRSEPL